MSRARRPRPRRTWPQRLVIGLNIVIVLTALASAGVLAYTKETVSDIPRVGFGDVLSDDEAAAASGSTDRDTDGQGQDTEPVINVLLVGVDDVTGLPPEHILSQTRSGTQLTDTMIVMQIDPNTGRAAMLSIPRDLWVPINGGGSAKINSALALGGQEALVNSIKDALGIPIHRYVQVNFQGFLELMDVVGGIDVVVDYPLKDKKAQFELNRTGCVNLTPAEALGYVRARTLQALIDGSWTSVDSRSDLGRIDRQQDFLVISINRAFSEGLTDPGVLKGLIDNVLGGGYITLDDRITPQELLELADAFRNFEDDDIDRYTLPVTLGSAGEQSVVFLNEDEAQETLAVFRGQGAQNRLFRLAVRNGTLSPGLATEVGGVLAVEGFNVAETTNADRFDYATTTIRFDSTQRVNAVELERWLESGAVLQQRDIDTGGSVELIVGEDWAGVTEFPRDPVEVPTPVGGEQLALDDGAEQSEVVETTDPPGPTPTPTPTPAPISRIRGC